MTTAGLAVRLPTPSTCGSHIAFITGDRGLDCACGRRRDPKDDDKPSSAPERNDFHTDDIGF
jgi:hypothetical protein